MESGDGASCATVCMRRDGFAVIDRRVFPSAARSFVIPDLADLPAGAALSGQRLGAFVLCEQLGAGGMGRVYRAERVDGSIRQQVAIKVVRRELLDAETRRRFLQERQTLASLEHPNIARLLDAAELEDGAPYFVMEYVAGMPITEYCEHARLGMRERVAIVRIVCDAVALAHRNLIVHRDIKPGNLLVTAAGVPKLLDFGIAKPLLTDAERDATGTAQHYFSPAYAAPEQLLRAPIGVGCDVYALGLLLYELLAGVRPFNLDHLSPGQIERLITTVPPMAPSAAARAAGRGKDIARQVRGDLDGIVLRCLRKAPAERYASVEQLEADLGNYLDGRPVQASGGHLWYRLQKFVRRNLAPVIASALLVLALLGAMVAFAWQARIAARQTQIAMQRAAELQRVSNFQAEMLSQVDANQAGILLSNSVRDRFDAALGSFGLAVEQKAAQRGAFSARWQQLNATDMARELIDQTILRPAVAAIETQFKQQPVVDAALRQVLADRYRDMGMLDAAVPLQEQALAIRRQELGEEHDDTLASLNSMGELLRMRGKLDEAEASWRTLLALSRRLSGPDAAVTLSAMNNLGLLLSEKGKTGEAEPYYREVLEKRLRLLGDEHPNTLDSMNNMASLLQAQGKWAEAERYHRQTLEKRRKVLGEDAPDTMTSLNNLGFVLQMEGRLAEAESFNREVLAGRRRVLGEEHSDTLVSINNVGALLEIQGKVAEAEPYRREALAVATRTLGPDHPGTLFYADALGGLLKLQGKHEDAELYLRQATDGRIRILGPEHPDTFKSMSLLGLFLQSRGRLAEAEPYLAETLERSSRVLGKEHVDTLRYIARLGSLRVAQSRYAEAVDLLGPAEAAIRKAFPGGNARATARVLTNLGKARAALGQFALAESNLLESRAMFPAEPGPFPEETRACLQALTELYRAWHRAEPAAGHAARGAEWVKALADFDAAVAQAAGKG